MLDQYQVGLTRMLEGEQYQEAKQLLQFLLQCQGQEKQHSEEWSSLLEWLNVAFPEGQSSVEEESLEKELGEEKFRQDLLNPPVQDEAYTNQVLYIMQHHPMIDQQMLALERAAFLEASHISDLIKQWLENEAVHGIVQFKALQCLRKRGATGSITMKRMDERVQLEVDDTPLSMDDFPSSILQILDRTVKAAEIDDPTLPHFARELWKDSLQLLYGTTAYHMMINHEQDTIDCFAAALHLTLQLTVYGSANDDDNREQYGITDELRFRYEQACRILRGAAILLESGDDDLQT